MLISKPEKQLIEELAAGILECKNLLGKGNIENIDKKICRLSCIYDCLATKLLKNEFSINVMRELIREDQASLKKYDPFEELVTQLSEKNSFIRQKGMDLEEIQHDLWFCKGKIYFLRGMIVDALNCWERVLVSDPGNKYIKGKLEAIESDFDGAHIEQIKEIKNFYYFREIGTAELSNFKWASGLCVDKKGLIISGCYLTKHVVLFDKDLEIKREFECDVVPQHLAISDNYLICSNQKGEFQIINFETGERNTGAWVDIENAGREMIVCQRGGDAPYAYDVEKSELKILKCDGQDISCEAIGSLKRDNCIDAVTRRMLFRGIFGHKGECFYYNQKGNVYSLDNTCIFKPPFEMKNISAVYQHDDCLVMMDNKEKAIFGFSMHNEKYKKISWEIGECVRMLSFGGFIYYFIHADSKATLNKIYF